MSSPVLEGQNYRPAQASKSLRQVTKKSTLPNYLKVNESSTILNTTPNPTVHAYNRAFGDETIIGRTYYDLQTNSSINYRLENFGDGTLSATWTHSSDESVGWPDRGMAYHRFDGSSWTKLPDYDDEGNIIRVEDVRTGFGSLSRVEGVGDIIVSHQTAINALQISRNTSFTEENWIIDARTEMPLIWPRMRVGGPDGKTVHIIALTEPEGGNFTGSLFNGLNGALLYNRSTDGGQSFDKLLVQPPNADSSIFNGFGGDGYAMDVKGNTIAFVAGTNTSRVEMWKSIDNGETWTSRTVNPFPSEPWDDSYVTDFNGNGEVDSLLIEPIESIDTLFEEIVTYETEIDSMAIDSTYEYILDENQIPIDSFYVYDFAYDTTVVDSMTMTIIAGFDTTFGPGMMVEEVINTNDGSFAIIIDNNDQVHVWYGALDIWNEDANDDGAFVYFPGRGAISYWNEGFALDDLPVDILGAVDHNGDGVLDIDFDFTDGATTVPYGVGLASFPSAGIDADGNLYVAYQAVREGPGYRYLQDSDLPSYRHIYVSRSLDGGETWTDPVDVTPDTEAGEDIGFYEYGFCSMARRVDENIHLLFQRDGTPGSAVTIDDNTIHPFELNDIIYLSVSKEIDQVGINEVVSNSISDLVLQPNPANETASLRFNLETSSDISISVLNLLGQEVSRIATQKAAAGMHNINLSTSELTSGIYLVNVQAENKSNTVKLVVKH